MLIAGPREHAIVVHHRVAAKFGAGQVPNFHLSSFIGVQRTELPPMGESRRLFIHQSDYAKMVVAEFEKLHYGGKEIPGISTPLPVAEAKEGDALPSFVPILGSKAASVWNGKILWLARGTRPDLAFAAQRIGRRISTWVRADDAVPVSYTHLTLPTTPYV